jgi:hypothetical protein
VLCQRLTLHCLVSASNTALSVYSSRTPCCDKSHDSLLLHFFRNFEENLIKILLSVYLLHKAAIPKSLVFGQLVKNFHPSLNQNVHCGADMCQWNSYVLSHIHTMHVIKYCLLMFCCNTALLFWVWSYKGSPTSCWQIKILDYFCIASCCQYTIYLAVSIRYILLSVYDISCCQYTIYLSVSIRYILLSVYDISGQRILFRARKSLNTVGTTNKYYN